MKEGEGRRYNEISNILCRKVELLLQLKKGEGISLIRGL